MELLPNDILRETVIYLSIGSLSKFIQTNMRIYKVCIPVLNTKKDAFKEKYFKDLHILNFLVRLYPLNVLEHSIKDYIYVNVYKNDILEYISTILPSKYRVKELISLNQKHSSLGREIISGIADGLFDLLRTRINIYPIFWLIHEIYHDQINDFDDEQEDRREVDLSNIPDYVHERMLCNNSSPSFIYQKARDFDSEFETYSFQIFGLIQGIPALIIR